jgi:hypothetical protein
MILSYQRADLVELDAHLGLREVIHPRFRACIVDNRNITNEEALFSREMTRRQRRRMRPVVAVLLNGEARVRAFGRERWLEAGQMFMAGAIDEIELREQGASFRSFSFEWDPAIGSNGAPVGQLDHGALTPSGLETLRLITERLLQPSISTGESTVHLDRALAVLSAEGLKTTLPPLASIATAPYPHDARLLGALDKMLSGLTDRPMVVDLERELDVSARHVTRLLSSFNVRYDYGATSWRAIRRWRQLKAGTAFMTHRGATPTLVARRVGYGSISAFSRALADAGLPRPTRVREAVRALQ